MNESLSLKLLAEACKQRGTTLTEMGEWMDKMAQPRLPEVKDGKIVLGRRWKKRDD